MKVREARSYIEAIDREIANLMKLLNLTRDEWEDLADKLEINSPAKSLVNTSVNVMIAYRSILEERIDEAELSIE